MRQAVSRIQIWIRARMPCYSLKKIARPSAMHRGQRLQLAHPGVAQPNLGAFRPRMCHWFIPYPTRMPDGPAKRPGKYLLIRVRFFSHKPVTKSRWGINSSISCYTQHTGRHAELCQIDFLPSTGLKKTNKQKNRIYSHTGPICFRAKSTCIMTKLMGCILQVNGLEFHSGYYVHFRTNTLGKGSEPSYPSS